jgi:tetratricopeptide (TPR) repeat protein
MKNRRVLVRLCRLLLVVGLISVAANCSRQTETVESKHDQAGAKELVAQADILYTQRADLPRAREGIILLRRAMAADSGSFDSAWKLARLNYYLGAHTNERSERERAFNEGIDAGRRAVKIEDGRPEGHFWLGANLGGKAQASMMSGLTSVSEIRSQMERVIQLDEGFQGGSAYMALGQIDLETPRMLGGDAKRAVEVLEKGLRFGENNTLYRLRLAQAYLAVNRKEEARKQLEFIINAAPDPNFLPEHQEAVAEARRLLEEP